MAWYIDTLPVFKIFNCGRHDFFLGHASKMPENHAKRNRKEEPSSLRLKRTMKNFF